MAGPPAFAPFLTSPSAEVPTFLAGLAQMLLPLRNEPLPGTPPPPPFCPQALPFIVYGPGLCLIQVCAATMPRSPLDWARRRETQGEESWGPGPSELHVQQILNPLLLVHPPDSRLCHYCVYSRSGLLRDRQLIAHEDMCGKGPSWCGMDPGWEQKEVTPQALSWRRSLCHHVPAQNAEEPKNPKLEPGFPDCYGGVSVKIGG